MKKHKYWFLNILCLSFHLSYFVSIIYFSKFLKRQIFLIEYSPIQMKMKNSTCLGMYQFNSAVRFSYLILINYFLQYILIILFSLPKFFSDTSHLPALPTQLHVLSVK